MRIKKSQKTILTSVLVLLAVHSPSSYADQKESSLIEANYTVYSGDINGDGTDDLLLEAKRLFAVASIDPIVILRIASASPSFFLQSKGSSYQLIIDRNALSSDSPKWTPNNFEILHGDVNGDGIQELLLRSLNNDNSFVIRVSELTGAPVISQVLTKEGVGGVISGINKEVLLTDVNNDGRFDIVVYFNDTITDIFLATSNGVFALPKTEEDDVIKSWLGFCFSLASGNINSAASFIHPEMRQRYSEALHSIGDGVSDIPQYWSELELIRINDEIAEYVVTQDFNGERIMHMITFRFNANSNRWQLVDF